eukprot:101659_1
MATDSDEDDEGAVRTPEAIFVPNKKDLNQSLFYAKRNVLKSILNYIIRININKIIPKDIYKLFIKFIGKYNYNYLFMLLTNEGIYGWELLLNKNKKSLTSNKRIIINKSFKNGTYDNFNYYYHSNILYKFGNFSIDRSKISMKKSKKISYQFKNICKIPWNKNKVSDPRRTKVIGWRGDLMIFNNDIFICYGGTFEYNDGSGGNTYLFQYNINTKQWNKYSHNNWYNNTLNQINENMIFINTRNHINSVYENKYLYYPKTGVFKEFNPIKMSRDFVENMWYYAPFHIDNKNKLFGGKDTTFQYYDFYKNKGYLLSNSNFNNILYNKSLFWYNDNPQTLFSISMGNINKNKNIYISIKDILECDGTDKK